MKEIRIIEVRAVTGRIYKSVNSYGRPSFAMDLIGIREDKQEVRLTARRQRKKDVPDAVASMQNCAQAGAMQEQFNDAGESMGISQRFIIGTRGLVPNPERQPMNSINPS